MTAQYRAVTCLTVNGQIVSVQTLHYMTMALLIPPLLFLFAEKSSLEYEGGAANVGTYIALDITVGLFD